MIATENRIGGYHQSNIPFVRSVHLIKKSDVISVLDPVRFKLPGGNRTHIPFGGIRIRTGTMITRMMFPPQSCSFSQPYARSDSGLTSSPSINFPMPASRDDVLEWYLENSETQFVCLMEDNNSKAYIIGNEERGLRPAMSQSIGSVNDFSISLSGTFNLPLFVLRPIGEGVNLSVLFPDTDFSIDFSLDFNA